MKELEETIHKDTTETKERNNERKKQRKKERKKTNKSTKRKEIDEGKNLRK